MHTYRCRFFSGHSCSAGRRALIEPGCGIVGLLVADTRTALIKCHRKRRESASHFSSVSFLHAVRRQQLTISFYYLLPWDFSKNKTHQTWIFFPNRCVLMEHTVRTHKKSQRDINKLTAPRGKKPYGKKSRGFILLATPHGNLFAFRRLFFPLFAMHAPRGCCQVSLTTTVK